LYFIYFFTVNYVLIYSYQWYEQKMVIGLLVSVKSTSSLVHVPLEDGEGETKFQLRHSSAVHEEQNDFVRKKF